MRHQWEQRHQQLHPRRRRWMKTSRAQLLIPRLQSQYLQYPPQILKRVGQERQVDGRRVRVARYLHPRCRERRRERRRQESEQRAAMQLTDHTRLGEQNARLGRRHRRHRHRRRHRHQRRQRQARRDRHKTSPKEIARMPTNALTPWSGTSAPRRTSPSWSWPRRSSAMPTSWT